MGLRAGVREPELPMGYASQENLKMPMSNPIQEIWLKVGRERVTLFAVMIDRSREEVNVMISQIILKLEAPRSFSRPSEG